MTTVNVTTTTNTVDVTTETGTVVIQVPVTSTVTTTAVGPQGPSGKTVLNGSGAPNDDIGDTEDFYIDILATTIYGPKFDKYFLTEDNFILQYENDTVIDQEISAWGSPTSLVGPQGPQGDNDNAIAYTIALS
jgi:hypothetical protein